MFLEGLHEKEIFTENYPFRLEVNFSENFHYPLHWHNAIELVYALENGCKVNVSGVEYVLQGKEILFIAAGEVHDIHASTIGKRIFIQFDVFMFDGFESINNVKPFISQTKKISYIDDAYLHFAIESHIIKIIEEYEKKEFAYALSLNARIYDILVNLSRNQVSKVNFKNTNSSTKKLFGMEKINSAFKYIEKNYQNDITLKDVSNAVGFSEFHFSRIFKEITEKNFHRYLNEFRIKKAEKLLMNNCLKVSQIAHEVGFNSFVTFNRTFKNVKGCSPSFYKKIRI